MSLRPIVRDLIRQPLRLPTERRGGWSPLALFAAGEQGGWWDPSDFSTMFQDSAGTTPVTAVGQPVGLIRDKSGRGNHLSQGTAASRPTLQQDASGYFYIQPDGVDDSLVTAAPIGLSGPSIAMSCGVNFSALPAASNIWGAGRYKFGSATSGAEFTSLSTHDYLDAGYGLVIGTGVVMGGQYDAAFSFTPRKNGVTRTTLTNAVDGANAEAVFTVGVTPFSGRIYQLMVRRAVTASAQLDQMDRYTGSKMGLAI